MLDFETKLPGAESFILKVSPHLPVSAWLTHLSLNSGT